MACTCVQNDVEIEQARQEEGQQIAEDYAERTDPKDSDPPKQDDDFCNSEEGLDVPFVDDCVLAEIACGDEIIGHTGGGQANWSNRFYETKYCTPMPQNYKGKEAVYRFQAPPNSLIAIELESPCADLDLFTVQWSGDGCPTLSHNTGDCDADAKTGDGTIELWQDKTPRQYLIGVDGKRAAEAPFTLSVTCHERE